MARESIGGGNPGPIIQWIGPVPVASVTLLLDVDHSPGVVRLRRGSKESQGGVSRFSLSVCYIRMYLVGIHR